MSREIRIKHTPTILQVLDGDVCTPMVHRLGSANSIHRWVKKKRRRIAKKAGEKFVNQRSIYHSSHASPYSNVMFERLAADQETDN